VRVRPGTGCARFCFCFLIGHIGSWVDRPGSGEIQRNDLCLDLRRIRTSECLPKMFCSTPNPTADPGLCFKSGRGPESKIRTNVLVRPRGLNFWLTTWNKIRHWFGFCCLFFTSSLVSTILALLARFFVFFSHQETGKDIFYNPLHPLKRGLDRACGSTPPNRIRAVLRL
jgi:hypothetical protein